MKSTPSETDVLVIGGGMAGTAAAVVSAAAGAKTVLVERAKTLGGNASQANVHTFCGLYDLPVDEHFTYANPGFGPWFAENLLRSGGAMPPEVQGRVGVMPTFPPRLAELCLSTARSTPELQLALETKLESLEFPTDTHSPAEAWAIGPDGPVLWKARIVIDTSGDAVAAARSDAETEAPTGSELQNATLILRVSGANPDDLVGYGRLRVSATAMRGSETGALPSECQSILVRPGQDPGEAYISLNLPKPPDRDYAPLNDAFMAEYMVFARDLGERLIGFLRDHLAGWSGCEVIEWPNQLGVRESRHMLGIYVLTESDILGEARFDDAVCRSAWPIELWHGHLGAALKYPEGPADIPLRALISRTHPNLGAAGRCMSGTHEALGALRVLGTAMATGEAIGIAAAIAIHHGCALGEVDASEIGPHRNQLIHARFQRL